MWNNMGSAWWEPPRRSSPGSGVLENRYAGHRRPQLVLGEVQVLHGLVEVGLVGRHVEVAVAAQRREDRLLLAALLAPVGLPDRRRDGVRRLRGRDDALRPREH